MLRFIKSLLYVEGMTRLEKADAVLELIYTTLKLDTFGLVEVLNETKEKYPKWMQESDFHSQVSMILEKLFQDKYIDKKEVVENTTSKFHKNQKGTEFIEFGGYVMQKIELESLITERKRQSQIAETNADIQRRLLALNRILAFGTTIAGTAYLIHISVYFSGLIQRHRPLLYSPFVTSCLVGFGVLLGVCLTLIGRRLMQPKKKGTESVE